MYVLRIFWGKKHEWNTVSTVSDMSTFFAQSKHVIQHGSTRLCYFSTND